MCNPPPPIPCQPGKAGIDFQHLNKRKTIRNHLKWGAPVSPPADQPGKAGTCS
jgi:hypothetical protein